MPTFLIGIDPGITGAVCIMQAGHAPVVLDLPTVEAGKGVVKRELDGSGLARILEYLPIHHTRCIIERTSAMPGQGVASMFSMGVSRGVILGVISCLALPLQEVAPARWKKHFGLIGADKDMSRRYALQLYPALADKLARAKDHNRAEAVLLAHYLGTNFT